jgi:hypothetical protein
MSFCFVLVIILSLTFYYYQAVILPAVVAKERVKLYSIIEKLSVLRAKNTVSHNGYVAFKFLLKFTIDLLSDKDDLNSISKFDTKDIDLSKDTTYQNIRLIENSRNYEAKDLIREYLKILSSINSYPKYIWLFSYFFPFFFSVYLREKLLKILSQNSVNWTKNIFGYSQSTNYYTSFVQTPI